MMGDCNVVENPLDRSTSSSSHGFKKIKLTRTYIKYKYNIEAYFLEMVILSTHGIIVGMMHKSPCCVGRFYVFSNLVQNPSSHILHYKVLGDSYVSHYHPISLLIDLSTSCLGGSS